MAFVFIVVNISLDVASLQCEEVLATFEMTFKEVFGNIRVIQHCNICVNTSKSCGGTGVYSSCLEIKFPAKKFTKLGQISRENDDN